MKNEEKKKKTKKNILNLHDRFKNYGHVKYTTSNRWILPSGGCCLCC